MQVDDDGSVGRWVSGKWSVGRWVVGLVVGRSVVGGFNKTHHITELVLLKYLISRVEVYI